jgi:hypothetical protein
MADLSEAVLLNPPVQINFTQPSGDSSSQTLDIVTYLTITNRSLTKNIAYKVKTTAPKFYQVKPF